MLLMLRLKNPDNSSAVSDDTVLNMAQGLLLLSHIKTLNNTWFSLDVQ